LQAGAEKRLVSSARRRGTDVDAANQEPSGIGGACRNR
jgi:hypothetical protein